jgi:hypothetical protein
MQVLAGLVLALTALLALAGGLDRYDFLFYPLAWWAALLLWDRWNYRRWGASPMRSDPGNFWGVIVPLSVIYWLYFEFVNLAFPQWRYAGQPDDPWLQTAMSLAAFGTVIPIVVEAMWFLAGPVRLTSSLAAFVPVNRRSGTVLLALGLALAAAPLASPSFWFNQAMWVAPLFISLALLAGRAPEKGNGHGPRAFLLWGAAAGLLGGLLWEFLNFWAPAKWEYFVLPGAARIFEMPLLGYLGFIPFAWSTLAVYLWAKSYRGGRWSWALWAEAALIAWLFIRLAPP